MGLFEDLQDLSKRAKQKQAHIKGEEATKMALVQPFLQVLGFDISDPSEIKPEYVADFAKKKPAGQFEKIDYAIFIDSVPSIFIECKAVNVPAEDHDGQLARYFNPRPSVRLAIITNGIQYRFFTDLRQPNIMDSSPFMEFNILNFSKRDAEWLQRFSRANFKGSLVESHAENILFNRLLDNLCREPSENFVRFILGELDLASEKRKSAIFERYAPILKESIDLAFQGMMTRAANQEQGTVQEQQPTPPLAPLPMPPPAPLPIPPLAPSPAPPEPSVLTEEEQKSLDQVRRICSKSPLVAHIDGRTDARFFSIHLHPTRTWFLRLRIGAERRSCMTRLPLEEAKKLVVEGPGLLVDKPSEQWGASRVVYESMADLEKLDRLIRAAYEEAMKRNKAAGAGGDKADE